MSYVSAFNQKNFVILDCIDTGQLMEGFSRLIQESKNAPERAEELKGSCYDRLMGGCLRLSILLVNEIHSRMDFSEYDGVFCYEYLDYSGLDHRELPAWIFPRLNWYRISEEADVPDPQSISALVIEWMQFCNLPFKKEVADDTLRITSNGGSGEKV